MACPSNILIVDDDPIRHEYLVKRIWSLYGPRTRLTHRMSAEEVVRTDVTRANLIMLDHDLCPAHFQGASHSDCKDPAWDPTTQEEYCPHGTGFTVTRSIVARVPDPTKRFIVHSMNYQGATQMANLLRKHGWRVVQRSFDRFETMPRGEFKQLLEG